MSNHISLLRVYQEQKRAYLPKKLYFRYPQVLADLLHYNCTLSLDKRLSKKYGYQLLSYLQISIRGLWIMCNNIYEIMLFEGKTYYWAFVLQHVVKGFYNYFYHQRDFLRNNPKLNLAWISYLFFSTNSVVWQYGLMNTIYFLQISILHWHFLCQ